MAKAYMKKLYPNMGLIGSMSDKAEFISHKKAAYRLGGATSAPSS